MSKTSLLRELRCLEKDQLIDIIIQAYSAGKETKEYFDFFTNPDPKGMYDKYALQIDKELSRVKRGRRTKARISVIKACIRKFSSFEPGSELVTDLYLYAIERSLLTEKNVYFSETLFNGVKKLAADAVVFADRQGTTKQFLAGIERMMNEETGTKYFRRLVKEGVADGMLKLTEK